MVIKRITILSLFLSLTLLSGCVPGAETDCNSGKGEAIVNNLVGLSPLQNVYNRGDVITVKVDIPSKNHFFGAAREDIFSETKANNAQLIISMFIANGLFQDNTIEYVKGSLAPDKGVVFNMPYNPVSDAYEFEIKVTLNRLGNYSLPAYENSDEIIFKGDGECNFYIIGTNKSGGNQDNKIEFTVQ